MKSIFKFAAMAFAAVAMLASCDKDQNGKKDSLSIDGKQWQATWDMMGDVPCLFDFGLTTSGVFYFAYDTSAMQGPGWMTYFTGSYTIAATDETSGVITFQNGVTLNYKDLTANSVTITSDLTYQEDVVYTLITEKKALLDEMGVPIE